MRAEDWMTRDVRTCGPETSLHEAAGAMWEGDCGILPVVNAKGVAIGVVTDRDLCMGAYLTGRSPQELQVGDTMARQLHACAPSDPIEQVIRVMGDHRVRRVPVLDGQGRPIGIVALNDIVRHLVEQGEATRARLAPRVLEAMAAICETRAGQAVPELVPAPPSRVRRPAPTG
ncbi:MAG TPA: CBS domain-containing protein [Planctomycetota bacterium]